MKEIVISIKPAYAHAILSGAKLVELRRRFPVNVSSDTKVLIYSSSPEKALIGECRINKVVKAKTDELWKMTCRDAMISWDKFNQYFEGREEGYGIYVHSPKLYERPISLNRLREMYDFVPPQSFVYNKDMIL